MSEPTMRGFSKLSHQPDDVAVVDLPVPAPGPGEVVVEVAGCGVCGSDLHAVRSDPGYQMLRPPVVLGHECAGRVAAVGPDVHVAVGDPVAAVSTQGCGHCASCHRGSPQLCAQRRILGIHYDGGLATYVRLEARHLVPVPAELDLVDAALAEPLSVAVHATLERSTVRPGSRVVVTGPGPIGLLATCLASAAGADVLVLGTAADRALRLPLAERLGAATADLTERSAADAVRGHFGGAPPDLWLETSGAPAAFDAALAEIGASGQVTVVAQYTKRVEMFVPDVLRREISLVFSYAANAAAYATGLRLLAGGVVPAGAFTTRYPLDRTADALADVTAGQVVKAVVVPR